MDHPEADFADPLQVTEAQRSARFLRVIKAVAMPSEEVLEMESRLAGVDEAYDPAPADDEDVVLGPSSYLTEGESENPAWVVEDEEITEVQTNGLHAALTSLDPRSRDIVESRWLTDNKMGLKELSARYGVSMERIRQIEAKAFEKMQPYLETV